MFCQQCEQTAGGKGCTVKGVCGKSPQVAGLQDALIQVLKGIGVYGQKARALGVIDSSVDNFVRKGLFTTVTNVNFDPDVIVSLIKKAYEYRDIIKNKFLTAYKAKNGKDFNQSISIVADWNPGIDPASLIVAAESAGILSLSSNEDIRSLKELILLGIKGIAAYADHAFVLGKESQQVNEFFYTALAALADDSLSADQLTGLVLETGKINLACMELLDAANTQTYGHPEPTKVKLGFINGPAIIVSGHDLKDLYQILEQTQGKGINVYTHGEMLACHAYPGLKRFKHLAGHFGTAWQNQQKEFDGVPAAFVFTTNCIQQPKETYKANVFTSGLVAWPGCQHVCEINGKKDFSLVIKKALELGGFKSDNIEKEITIGFARNTVMSVAEKVIEAVKAKKIRRFFLIGGCDGAKPGRNYYTEFAQKVPADCLILTLACGKFRFNKLEFGDILGIPRLLDMGQCNDAYSAIQVAIALAKAFNCSVNELPLSMILSWYEQKAVCILLTLLYLGIENIKLGPSLPAFVSPNVLKVLVDKFKIAPISTPDADLKEILG